MLHRIETTYQEELKIGDQVTVRSIKYDILNAILQNFMPITVFGTYVALGNTLSLSQMGLTTVMLDRIRVRISHHVPFYYKEYFNTM